MSFQIDLDQIEDEVIGGAIPKGSYDCIVELCTLVETKAGGRRVKVQYKVIDGKYANSRIWDSLMVVHPNPKVVDIGLKGIKRLANALGVAGKINDPSDLATGDKIVRVTVDVQSDDSYGESNIVKRVTESSASLKSSDNTPSPVSGEAAPF